MTRLRDIEIEWDQLVQISRHYGLPLQYRKARCQHGKTRREACRDCEAGYTYDTSIYANLPEVATLARQHGIEQVILHLAAVSDDHEDVAFISKAQMDRLERVK